MGRGPRIQYEGALYHVINRGNFKRDIFETDGAKRVFEECVFEGCDQAGWRLLGHAIMRNHFHLVVETPRPNLSVGMQWIQSTFAARFIRYRSERGHLFEGRYKSPLLQPGPVLLRVVNYVHLNPVRAGACELPALEDYRWSSLGWFRKADRPAFMTADPWRMELGIGNDAAGWHAYNNHLNWQLADAEARARDETELTRGWAIGTPSWKRETFLKFRSLLGRHRLRKTEREELERGEWSECLQRLLAAKGMSRAEVDGPKGAEWKVEMAADLRRLTSATNDWISQELKMGGPDSLSVYLSHKRKSR